MAITKASDLPKKSQDLFQKAMSAMERDNLHYAIDIFSSLLELHPHALEIREMLRAAEIKQLHGRKRNQFTNILAYVSGAGNVLAITGSLKNKPAKSLKAAEGLLKKDPLNKYFLALHARAAIAADIPEAAIHSLKLAHETYPKDANILSRLAEAYQNINNTSQAKICYEKLVHLRPNDPKAIKAFKDACARETMDKGGWEESEDYRGVLKDKDEAVLLEQDAKSMKSEKDVESLIKENEERMQAEPANVTIRRALAELYAKTNRFEDALSVLDDAQKLTGGGDPQVDRAITLIKTRQFEHLVEKAREAGDEEQVAKLEAEQEEFIYEDLKDRVRRYPNDLQLKYEYGMQLFKRDMITEAIQQFQLSQRNPQRRIRSLYYLALCFKEKNQFDIAAEQLEKASEELSTMDETKKDIIYELGLLHEAMGNKEKAVEYFKKIYAVDIGYREIAAKIESSYQPGNGQ